MRKILIVFPWYLPGYKGGGPIRTLANMVEWLGDDFQLYIVTSDRDLGDHQPYSGIRYGVWQPVGKAQVLYLAPQEMTLSSLYRLFRTFTCDLLYLNSFFAPLTVKLMLLRRIGLLPKRPCILAPRGEFSPGALALKQYKKRIYIFLIKVLRLYANITWQASSEFEEKDILSILGKTSIREKLPIKVAPNLPPRKGAQAIAENISKRVGSVRVIFLSRIARKKNLDTALTFLAKVSGEVLFDIYGPIEDAPYWKECENLIYKLPGNVLVNYKGLADPEQVVKCFSAYHLFLFPTRGENFGHVILEALRGGCLILTSDQTPWSDLEESGAGWGLPLDQPDRFQVVLQKCVEMDQDEYAKRRRQAVEYGLKVLQDEEVITQNRNLFGDTV